MTKDEEMKGKTYFSRNVTNNAVGLLNIASNSKA